MVPPFFEKRWIYMSMKNICFPVYKGPRTQTWHLADQKAATVLETVNGHIFWDFSNDDVSKMI